MADNMRQAPEVLSGVEKTMDKTRLALESLKDQISALNFDVFFESVVKPAIIEDCREAGRDDANEVTEKMYRYLETTFINQTPEKRNLDKFMNDASNVTGFEKINQSIDPKAAVLKLADSIEKAVPGAKWAIGAWLMSMAENMKKENEGKDTFFSNMIRKIVGWLGGKGEKPTAASVYGTSDQPPATTPPTAPPAGEAAPPAAGAEAEEEEPESGENQKYVDLFKNVDLQLNEQSIQDGLEKLNKKNVKREEIIPLIQSAMQEGGNLKKIADILKSKYPDKTIAFDLADILFQKFDVNQMEEITKRLSDGRKFLVLSGARSFLNEMRDAENFDKTIKEYPFKERE